MFVSIDEDCVLDIILKSNKEEVVNKTVIGFNRKGSLKKWERIEIQAPFTGNVMLSFKRTWKGLDNTLKEGYWAIDQIQYCKNNIGWYTIFCKLF